MNTINTDFWTTDSTAIEIDWVQTDTYNIKNYKNEETDF